MTVEKVVFTQNQDLSLTTDPPGSYQEQLSIMEPDREPVRITYSVPDTSALDELSAELREFDKFVKSLPE